ncbi:MAG: flagellar biosynthetic protein FliR [Eubacteriales bacterium]
MSIIFDQLLCYLLIFVRMCGMLLTNPLFSRSNIPIQVRLIFVLTLSILIAPSLDSSSLSNFSDVDFVLAVLLEALTGIAIGMVFQLFYYMVLAIGDVIDFNLGLSMARVFDPGSNIQMSISGTLLSAFFVLYLFSTDSHLELIKVFASTYKIVPIGARAFATEFGSFFSDLFAGLFSFVLKLALPFIIAQFILEASMGILMKIVPQIHVFVMNIQMKLLLGLSLMFLLAAPVSGFLDKYISVLFSSFDSALKSIASSG